METRNTPPVNGLSVGPMIVACQWYISSPTGPKPTPPIRESILKEKPATWCVLESRKDPNFDS